MVDDVGVSGLWFSECVHIFTCKNKCAAYLTGENT